MKKAPLYSRSPRPTPPLLRPAAKPSPAAPTRWAQIRSAALRHERRLWALSLAALLLFGLALQGTLQRRPAPLSLDKIEAALRASLEEKPLAAAEARAYQAILPSLVRVVGQNNGANDGSDENEPRGVGSGVVIVDSGIILTNLHVVAGAKRIKVTFATGLESDATVTGVYAEHDLAVLKAKSIPDDLPAATMRSTGDLLPGDHVIAVGFPFGIGPSVSSGVVSGLKREFRSPEGDRVLTNLIQFDAAANPGNSGGPLVTLDGAVVGIVTAILNPSRQRVFIGIGFAVPIENAASAAGMPPF
ncbi:MAG: trypsin-like peptidase domain-containing protein [Burkholderiaceae bacterium]